MNRKGISPSKVAATYIGTVVGAGFATGQEILQFFTRFGALGIFGLASATIMFIIFGYIIMSLGRKLNAQSHLEIVRHVGGGKFGTIMDFIITFFLFGSFSAMIAGTGALFAQQFNMPALWGNILMSTLTAATVLTGINGVINSISFVVPFLLAAVIGTSIFSILESPPNLTASVSSFANNNLISNWALSSVLYVSYNIILSVAVLGSLGHEAIDEKAVKKGAVLGGLGLGIGAAMIYLSLIGNIAESSSLEVPMVYISGKMGSIAQTCYAIVLIAEIYTTAVGSLYGFVSRITDIKEFSSGNIIIILIITIAALLASQFGFSNLVKFLYPLVGYVGIMLLLCLIAIKFRRKV